MIQLTAGEIGYSTHYNYIDVNGKRLFDYGFREATHFDENGIAVAKKLDGSYVFLSCNGIEIAHATFDDFEAWENKLKKHLLNEVSDEYKDKLKEKLPGGARIMHCCNEHNGLIPIIFSLEYPSEAYGIDYVRKLGFADTEGNIIVQPDTIETNGVLNGTFWNEDKMIINYDNRLAILNITVSFQ